MTEKYAFGQYPVLSAKKVSRAGPSVIRKYSRQRRAAKKQRKMKVKKNACSINAVWKW
jgi:hypothetical protein